jgi:hypothetical protein
MAFQAFHKGCFGASPPEKAACGSAAALQYSGAAASQGAERSAALQGAERSWARGCDLGDGEICLNTHPRMRPAGDAAASSVRERMFVRCSRLLRGAEQI